MMGLMMVAMMAVMIMMLGISEDAVQLSVQSLAK